MRRTMLALALVFGGCDDPGPDDGDSGSSSTAAEEESSSTGEDIRASGEAALARCNEIVACWVDDCDEYRVQWQACHPSDIDCQLAAQEAASWCLSPAGDCVDGQYGSQGAYDGEDDLRCPDYAIERGYTTCESPYDQATELVYDCLFTGTCEGQQCSPGNWGI